MVLTDDARLRPFGRPSLWLFADTGDEPRRVYAHVEEWGNRITDGGMEFARVKRDGPSLSEHTLTRAEAGQRGISMPPVYVERRDKPGRMPMRRGCTRDFKTNVLDAAGLAWLKARGETRAAKWYGISFDEVQRTRTPDRAWYDNVYPLVDLRLRRTDCLTMLAAAGFDAPRSACSFCPFHSNEEWRRVREDADDWQDVIDFERRLRAAYVAHGHVAGLATIPSLHPSGLPIDEAPIDTAQEGFGWGNECAGVCGV
jgi:hypothetical protein